MKPASVTVENKSLFGGFCLVGFFFISLFGKLSVMHFVATGFVLRHFLMLNELIFKVLCYWNLSLQLLWRSCCDVYKGTHRLGSRLSN